MWDEKQLETIKQKTLENAYLIASDKFGSNYMERFLEWNVDESFEFLINLKNQQKLVPLMENRYGTFVLKTILKTVMNNKEECLQILKIEFANLITAKAVKNWKEILDLY